MLIPEPRGAMPVRPAIAAGPQVRLWTDTLESSQRNWATLLQEPFDQDHMQYYVTGQLVSIETKKGAITKIGAPAMISAVEPSPDGRWLKVTRLERPFSYVVQYNSFATVDEIWDLTGKVVATVTRRPLREATDSTSVAREDGARQRQAQHRVDARWQRALLDRAHSQEPDRHHGRSQCPP